MVRTARTVAVILGSAAMLTGTAQAAQASRPGQMPMTRNAASPALALGKLPAPGPGLWWPSPLHGGKLPPSLPSAAPAGRWRAEPTPNPAVQRNGNLLGAACSGPTACTAVGSAFNGAGLTVPLAEGWNGTRWTIQPTPVPRGATYATLTGVSCAAERVCTAAGYYYDRAGNIETLAERWDGTRWAVQVTPNPAIAVASGFFAVSCTSAAACTATGDDHGVLGGSQPLAERWNGRRWTIQAITGPRGAQASGLFGVSCTGPAACTAAGAYVSGSGVTRTLAEAWNGTAWTIQLTRDPAGASGAGLLGVSCTSARACTAAGSYDTSSGTSASLAERWDGTRWSIQATPAPSGAAGATFTAVSCTSARACTAAGAYQGSTAGRRNSGSSGGGTALPLAEQWNGARWTVQSVPSPEGSTGTEFSGLACGTTQCAAVGQFTHGISKTAVPLTGTRNKAGWHVQAAPSRAGAAIVSEFTGISCRTPHACTAVGYYTKTPLLTVTLAESWNGARWRIQPTPNPAGVAGAALQAVSCASPRACTAVGSTDTGSDTSGILAEAWNGSRWGLQSVPAPAGSTSSHLEGVSCSSARACTAVGYYSSRGGSLQPLAERWNGQTWRIQPGARPSGVRMAELNAVSCPSARACTAVGFGSGGPLAEVWTGTRWSVQAVPLPAGATGGILQAVSCTARRACTATGTLFARPGGTWAVRWYGTVWVTQATPNPPDASQSLSQVTFYGVSCAGPAACTAIGNYTPSNRPVGFIEAWDGTRWRLQAPGTPAGTTTDYLGGVSCLVTGCTAAGAYTGLTGVTVTLAMSRR